MKRKLILSGWIMAALMAGAAGAESEDTTSASLNARQIVQKSNRAAYYQGTDGRAKVKMTITDAQGRTRSREFSILRMDVGDTGDEDSIDGEQKFYVYFHRPPDVNKMAYLVWKNIGKDDDRWLYLPALDLVKRIAASDERTSFVGSDFFYEDVSGRGIDEDEHELAEVTDAYYKIRNVPKNPASVEFAHYIAWIHKETFIPVQIEYFDKEGVKYRMYQALKVEKVDGFNTVTKSKMTDLRTKGFTENEYEDVKYNLGIPDEIFTERYLRRSPRQYLR